ncbi:MAG: class I SAM-dependent methyltransferase [Acidimicrobiales bacterium]
MLTVRYGWLGVCPGDRLLDLACGGGRHSFEGMRLGAVVTAVDRDAKELKAAAAWMAALLKEDKATSEAGGQGHALLGDALALPFPDGCFDRVIAAEVLEHLADDQSALAELARVTRPGGTIAASVPRYWPEAVNWTLSRDYHNVPGGHVRIYRRSQLRQRLVNAGFVPYAQHHAHALHSPYWWLRCAVGLDRAAHPLVKAYHRLLVWDMTAKSRLTRWPEALLNPVLGKSLVVYARKKAGKCTGGGLSQVPGDKAGEAPHKLPAASARRLGAAQSPGCAP